MVFFLYGADTFRSREKLMMLKEKFLRDVDPQGLHVVRLDGAVMALDDFRTALLSVSMFSRRRMIIVERLLEHGKQDIHEGVIELLRDSTATKEHVVVFWEGDVSKNQKSKKPKKQTTKKSPSAKALTDSVTQSLRDVLLRQKYVQEFVPLEGSALLQWIEHRVERLGGSIARDAAGALSACVGSDLWQMNQEIKKLCAYVAEGKTGRTISVHDVHELVHGENFEENIFALTDAIGQRQPAVALRLFEQEVAHGAAPLYIFTMIVHHMRILLMVKEMSVSSSSSRELAQTLQLHPFVTEKALRQSSAYSLARLRALYERLFAIERTVKTESTNPMILCEQFILHATQ